jgi:hypothetical protein
MECTPLDVLDIIFGLACTDDGTTGCSLSAVSRYMRDASAMYRYQAVALHGPRQITAFLSLLQGLDNPPASKSRMRRVFTASTAVRRVMPPTVHVVHLFVVDHCWRKTQGRQALLWKDWRKYKARKDSGLVGALNRAKLIPQEWMCHTAAETTLHELLSRLAPRLEHLAFHQQLTGIAAVHLVPVHLPVLEELMCRFGGPPGSAVYRSDRPPTVPVAQSATAPLLRRLNIITGSDSWSFESSRLLVLQQLPPLLSHLRLSNICDAPRLLSTLSTMAGGPSWPRGMERILLAPRLAADLHEALQVLPNARWRAAATYEGDVSTLVYMAEHLANSGSATLQMYNDWLNRVRGGDGCWEAGTAVNY